MRVHDTPCTTVHDAARARLARRHWRSSKTGAIARALGTGVARLLTAHASNAR